MFAQRKSIALRSSLIALALLLTTCFAALPQQRTRQTRLEKRAPQQNSASWWKHAVYYEIYPRSFYDLNGDGIGDLNGITTKLDYLQDLGVDAIWITPFYPSPQVDFGYDVSDYENVDPQFGTLADFDRLVTEAHKRNIKVICDLVLNHTSDQHKYFIESRSSRNNPKSDWYIWRDPGRGGGPPNNWLSIFGGSAWTFDKTRGQYYYHFFYAAQPDINWRNPDAARAIFDSVRFWLRRGVDGFRVDAIDHVFEDPNLRDNPTTGRTRADGTAEQEDRYTSRVAENHEVFRRLREVVDEFNGRVIMGETGAPPAALVAYYGRKQAEFHLPFNFALMNLRKLDAGAFRSAVGEIERELGTRPVNYVLSNHDRPRSYDTFGDGMHDDQIAKLLITMLLTLRGVPFFYYGEEIGMKTTPPERIEDVQDPVGKVFWPKDKGRDGERTPMQWTSGRNAGFSSAEKTWLPVPPTAEKRNVETMSKDPNSVLNFYKQAMRLRRASPALVDGDYTAIGDDPHVYAYRRRTPRHTMIVALNMSNQPRTLKLSAKDLGGEGKRLRVAISNLTHDRQQTVDAGQVTLAPYESAAFEVTEKGVR